MNPKVYQSVMEISASPVDPVRCEKLKGIIAHLCGLNQLARFVIPLNPTTLADPVLSGLIETSVKPKLDPDFQAILATDAKCVLEVVVNRADDTPKATVVLRSVHPIHCEKVGDEWNILEVDMKKAGPAPTPVAAPSIIESA